MFFADILIQSSIIEKNTSVYDDKKISKFKHLDTFPFNLLVLLDMRERSRDIHKQQKQFNTHWQPNDEKVLQWVPP